jgi:hypothetical protein
MATRTYESKLKVFIKYAVMSEISFTLSFKIEYNYFYSLLEVVKYANG